VTRAASTFTVAGTAKVVRFNWPKYVVVVGLVVAGGLAPVLGFPTLMVVGLGAVAAAGLIWTATSLLATWWVYDHRRVYDRIAVGIERVGSWASVHAGFDDATSNLAATIGSASQAVVALPVAASPSLRRARAGEAQRALVGAVDALPLPTASADSIFVTFAAHEIRDRDDQRALFGELRRALRPGGRLVVTEHLRDLANVAAFGPGAFHFQPASTWHHRAEEAGFDLETDRSITPFVHRMVWRR
jgi:SAM-dependent methyltransferase